MSRRDDTRGTGKKNGKTHRSGGRSIRAAGRKRRQIFEQVDGSLARPGTDYVDLTQIRRFDPEVPVEESIEALHGTPLLL